MPAPPSGPQEMAATLYFPCGKMAAGKSTLARELARRHDAVLLVQDQLLEALFLGDIIDVAAFLEFRSRLERALTPLVCDLLARGIPVVLDFPANTRSQRAWFRTLIDRSGARHELHYVDVPDDVCKRQLKERSRHLPEGTPWTSDAEFDAITVYFDPPSDEEGFTVIRHARS